MILKDTPRSIKSGSPSSRTNTAKAPISVSPARIPTSKSARSRSSVRTLPPGKTESECEKRDATSKEDLVRLFRVWQPQLCASYRPHVEYSPTDPDTIQAYVNAMVVEKQQPPRLEKFRAVERVVETVNHFNFSNHQLRGRDSRMSQGQIKT